MSLLLILIALALVLVTGMQVYFWTCIYARVAAYRERTQTPEVWPAISVVVCARNALQDLQNGLPTLLNQNYEGDWELIVVNDASTDATSEYLSGMATQFEQRLRVVTISEKTQPGKKQALDAGIRAAQFDWILVTDADCRPNSPNWIGQMARYMQPGTEIVLGFGPMLKQSGCLAAWQEYEAVYTAMQYFGWALAGMPYMGVGRNMAYRKSLFLGGAGFAGHLDLPSGDDDLFINTIAQKGTVALCMHPESFMYSAPKSDWRSYWRQKSRHFSTSPRYKVRHQWMLSLAGLSHSLHFFFMLVLLLAKWGTILVLLVAVIRIVILIRIGWPVLYKFHADRLQHWLFILDPLVAVYYTVFVPGVFFTTVNKPRSWT